MMEIQPGDCVMLKEEHRDKNYPGMIPHDDRVMQVESVNAQDPTCVLVSVSCGGERHLAYNVNVLERVQPVIEQIVRMAAEAEEGMQLLVVCKQQNHCQTVMEEMARIAVRFKLDVHHVRANRFASKTTTIEIEPESHVVRGKRYDFIWCDGRVGYEYVIYTLEPALRDQTVKIRFTQF